ncbi:hypothetical protein ST47_g559 [Ascochyta rabiei]|uniref:Rhodopsin domain-containing protein n=1 Tax=Didymella rabiei TaxID=5454 RepID=A0A163M0N2_DIDRA|nr:hypothetical protein ST47_g559 [Ascochyta rabiei]
MNSDAAEPSTIPWDTSVGNRFAHYSSRDHGATVWIATALGLTYVVGVLLVRVFIKRRIFGWDDWLILTSTVLASSQIFLTFRALSNGLGKVSEDVVNLRLVGRLVFSSRVIFLASHYLAKLSVLFLLRRLFVRDQKSTAMLCDITIYLTSASAVVSLLVSTIQCPTSSFFAGHCYGQVSRWSLVTALDVTTEIMTLVLPSYLVWQVQIGMKTKFRVIAAFCFRIAVVAMSAAHLNAWISYTNGPPSPLFVVPTIIWQHTLLATSLITATIPNLKAFLQSLSANWGEAGFGYTTKAYGNGTFEMHNMNSSAPPAPQIAKGELHPSKGGPGYSTQATTSACVAGERSSLGSSESQDLIIRKETAWTVERS